LRLAGREARIAILVYPGYAPADIIGTHLRGGTPSGGEVAGAGQAWLTDVGHGLRGSLCFRAADTRHAHSSQPRLGAGAFRMKFGLHYLLSVSESQSASQRYRDTLEQAVRAEGLGFESVWPVEQHFNQMQSALPCPTLLLAAIAARTTTLRLGTAIVQLPLAHPLRTAEVSAIK
jgi:hypothetical protein